jgi:thiol-disulfide isomerase/thioredoxin
MGRGYKQIKDEEEYNRILEENEYVFVIYSATWCGPCRSFKEMLDKDYCSYPHPIVVVDVDSLEELAIGISGLPTMVGFHNKKEFVRTEGFNKQKLQVIFQETLEKETTTETI